MALNFNPSQSFLSQYVKRYTEPEKARLEASGGPSMVNSAEYRNVVTNQDLINNWNDGIGSRRGYDSDSHDGDMYAGGNWSRGKLDAVALAEKYGLDRSQGDSPNNRDVDEGHIWGKKADGTEVYIGKADIESLASNKELIKNHSTQLHGNEVDHYKEGSELSSGGDVRGGLLTEWNGGETKPEAITEKQKIEFSPGVQRAKDNVANYINDGNSGKRTNDLYARSTQAKRDAMYDFTPSDPVSEIAPIDTIDDDDSRLEIATNSFLNNQKNKIKNKYNFVPRT